MSDAERLRRPEPLRSGPIRNATTYFRGKGSWDAPPGIGADQASGAPQNPDGAAPSVAADTDLPEDDPVKRGVQLGYQVIEEHIRQGRDAARGHCADGDGREVGADLPDFLARAIHLYQDAGSLVLDFVEHLAKSPALQAALRRGDENAATSGPRASPADETPVSRSIGVELTTARPARAWTELHPGHSDFTPMLDALRAAVGDAPPITDVQLESQPGDNSLMLRVSVASDQPPGTYTGVILDAATKTPRGTACVLVLE